MLLPRRDVMRSALALAAAACAPTQAAPQRVRFVGYPFRLGVASGYPSATGFTLWTRLAPSPLEEGGGMGGTGVEVGWEVAEDEAFGVVVASGRIGAFVENAFSVHVDVTGLRPGRWYFYRFMAGDEVSPVGRSRTAEQPGQGIDRFRLAFGSCQHFEHGYFAAHRHLHDEDLDLMLFLGDYIYEATWGKDLVRAHVGDEATTLGDYRIRYGQVRTDADLQRLHGAVPWLMVWDDHEVDNDWAAAQSEHLDPRFLERRAVAFQAFFEHMPVPRAWFADASKLYGSVAFGDLVRLYMLDDRSYRDRQACPRPGQGGSTVVTEAACAERLDPKRTLLGSAQEAWLDQAFGASKQTWNVLGQQTLMTSGSRGVGGDRTFWTDGWDGYPAARGRLLESMRKKKLTNPLVLGGDIHAAVVADLRLDPEDPSSPVVAAELCGSSITSQGGTPEESAQAMREHPDVRYANGWQRGYTVVELTPEAAVARVRVVDEKRVDSGIETVSTWRVEAGRLGLTPG